LSEEFIMRRYQYLAAAIMAAPLLCAGLGAQEPQKPAPQTTIKRVPVARLETTDGAELFRAYCAVCHGSGGKGDGPAAKALKTPPADLTTIAKRHGGKFPIKTVEETILADNDPPTVAHGTREMPLWGPIFRRAGGGRDVATMATANLLKHLESLQVK
jgi:mono/diheme cytochrome c family protein